MRSAILSSWGWVRATVQNELLAGRAHGLREAMSRVHCEHYL